jgi:hypothetical protein
VLLPLLGLYKNNYIDLRRRGGKIRLITGITKENIHYCKELMKIVDELHNLDEIECSIAVRISLPTKESHWSIHAPPIFYRVKLPPRLSVLFPAIPPLADEPS